MRCLLRCNLGGIRNLGCRLGTSSLGRSWTRKLGRKRTCSAIFWVWCFTSRWRSNVRLLMLISCHYLGLFLVSTDFVLLEKDFTFVFWFAFVITIRKMSKAFLSIKVVNQSVPVCIGVSETREVQFLFTNNAFVTGACNCICSIDINCLFDG